VAADRIIDQDMLTYLFNVSNNLDTIPTAQLVALEVAINRELMKRGEEDV